MAKKSIAVEMDLHSEHKKVRRFTNGSDKAAMSSAYVTKAALTQLGDPGRVRITIEPIEED